MRKFRNRLIAHLHAHWRKYAVELVLLVPLLILHSSIVSAAVICAVAALAMFREHVARHAKRHHRKLIALALILSSFYLFGALVPGPGSGTNIHIGPRASTPASDPFEGKGLADISPAGVDQHAVGDCFFESGVASESESASGRIDIYHMIVINRDASYTVTFPGAPSHPIQVFQSDLTKMYNHGWAQDSALWARIIETAFLKYDHAESYGTGIYSNQKEGIPFAAPVPPGGETEALKLLTGQNVATDSLSTVSGDWLFYHLGYTSEANLNATLQEALAKGEPVTLMVGDGTLGKIGFNMPGPLDTDHLFSLLSDKNEVVITRNPWGDNNPPLNVVKTTANAATYKPVDGITVLPDGELQMSLKTAMSFYSDINFAGINPTSNDFNNIGRDISNGSVGYFFGDSLYTATDLIDRGAANVNTNVWHGMKNLYEDIISL